MSRMRSIIWMVFEVSRSPVGSSRRSSFGSFARARAMVLEGAGEGEGDRDERGEKGERKQTLAAAHHPTVLRANATKEDRSRNGQ
jgi:hypothetical protein